MVVYVHQPPHVERQMWDEIDARTARLKSAGMSMTPQAAGDMAEMAGTWEGMPPGAVLGLVKAGVSPSSLIAQNVASRAVQTGFGEPDDVLTASAQTRDVEAGRDTWAPVRGLVRGLFTALQTPIEEVSRRVSAVGVAAMDQDVSYREAMELATPSIGAIAWGPNQGRPDLGEGWLPGGEARAKQEELKQQLQLDGEWVSPGRLLARVATEPGTEAYNVLSGFYDASFQVVGDPTVLATAGVGGALKSRKAFTPGLLDGIRKTTAQERAVEWATTSPVARRTWDWAAKTDDPYEIWTTTRKQLDRETVAAVTNATTPQEVMDIVIPKLGTTIREKPVGAGLSRGIGLATGNDRWSIGGVGVGVRRLVDDRARMLQWMPDGALDPMDMNRTLENVDRLMKGVKFDTAERAAWFRKFVDIEDGQPVKLLDAYKDLLSDGILPKLQVAGAKPEVIRKVGRIFPDDFDYMRSYWQASAGEHLPHPGLQVVTEGGKTAAAPSPHLMSEMLERKIPLPDMQLLRRNIGAYADIMNGLEAVWKPLGMTRTAFEGATSIATGVMTNVWKPMVLLRGAYITRVIGEEQVRMGAAGLSSMGTHPLDLIAGRSTFASIKRGARKHQDITGFTLDDLAEHHAVLQRGGGGWIGPAPASVYTGEYRPLRKVGTERGRYVEGWANDLSFHINDEVSSTLARMGPDEFKDYWWSGAGQNWRKAVAENPNMADVLRSRKAADEYVDSVWARTHDRTGGQVDVILRDGRGGQRAVPVREFRADMLGDADFAGYQIVQPGNQELIDVIATGRAAGKRVAGTNGDHRALHQLLEAHHDVGPDVVKSRHSVTVPGRASGKEARRANRDRVIDYLADYIMSKPTNWASRSPTWKQMYWRRVDEMMPFATAETQQQILKVAKTNLSAKELRALQRHTAKPGTSITSVDQFDGVAKAAATTDTRKLLYELTEVGQFSDLSRAIFPFAEAWKEIFVAWSRIAKERPQVVRRGQQVIEGARGSGIFYSDQGTGEEMFAYPLVGRAAAQILGLPDQAGLQMTGAVTGLNLFAGSVLPGIGPVAALPLSMIMPEAPDQKWMRDLIFPFGEPDIEGEGIVEAHLPAWARRLWAWRFTDPESDRVYANSMGDAMAAILAEADHGYDINNPDPLVTTAEQERLLEDAKQIAKRLMLVRGIAQFVLPTGPQAEFTAEDLEGEAWPFRLAAQEYHRLSQEHGQEAAVGAFLERFGPHNFLIMQPKSRTVLPRPTSETGADWLRRRPDLERDYRQTIGLITPEDPLGRFDYQAYLDQLDTGTREALTPEQRLWLGHNIMGRFAFQYVSEKIDVAEMTNGEKQAARGHAKAAIMAEYPGFNQHVGITPAPDAESQIDELRRLVADPRVRDDERVAETVDAVGEFLNMWDFAGAMVERTAKRSTTFKSSGETAPIRQWLRAQANQLMQRGDFAAVWDRVFARVLADDEPTFDLEGAA